MNNARRSLAVAIAALVGLGACTSNPSAKAVAEDVVESLPDLTDAQRTCMLAALDDYTPDQIQEIGEENEGVDFSDTDAVDTQGTPALQTFVADLNRCMGEA